uniref:Immunoglobulin C1-set domain-containing protein n=1 Tax=Bos mutus grunniens TaxID=30521 RepID=A0A8B9X7C7_BOSMU
MLPLPLLLLVVILPRGDNRMVRVTLATFANSSWAQNQGSGWLDDLQIQGWDSDLGTTIFLKPWSKGNFSDEAMTELQDLFRVYFIGFTRVVQDHVSEFQLEFEYNPFAIQVIAGCELHSGEAIESSLRGALGGLDFVRIQNHSCVPTRDSGSISDIMERLHSETCPRYLLGVLNAGKAELQKQVKPEAWLSSGPTPGPGCLLLVCHVSGFYPKLVRVMWMRGEQEQPGTQQGDIMPNADWTWYLRVTLDGAAGALLDPFDRPCIMVLEMLVISEYLIGPECLLFHLE